MAPITFDRVTKRFGDTTAVDELSLEIADGEFLVLVGPSGCGKSTALRMLAGLDDLTDGRILIDNRLVNRVTPGSRDVAMVFQSYALYPHMTVYDNLAFGLRNYDVAKPEIQRRVGEAARVLGLTDLLRRKPKQLSGGQRQRVAVARALANDPPLILADEPTGSLDSKSSEQVFEILRGVVEDRGKTVVAVTHDLGLAARMHRRIQLMDGAVEVDIRSDDPLALEPSKT
jgi:multiple sugar transport system ATP-binding protein